MKTYPDTFRVYCITGTPGTGKTEVAKALSGLLGVPFFGMVDLEVQGLEAAGFDQERACKVIDEDIFAAAALALAEHKRSEGCSGVIIESHMAHYLPENKVFCCIVLHCELPELKKRLTKRGYPEEKVRENLQAEIFDICGQEAIEAGHRCLEQDTSKTTAKQAATAIFEALKGIPKRTVR
ncbi:hypothetical protein AUJ68_03910 [Candidatus Woesearchaeota archaeon CG1_02_57_44]|nr:MAG: hypothetical protein AUJ68_03910 [Candidatus Woesearchaeota archaeon CG1_02_57_44]PIN70082.1 MAG: hypothetical protein COV94_02120 [Candidatus Woesearchaeota archaeon CG11_big_fil_rev_8_21_14_0_20_57_5]